MNKILNKFKGMDKRLFMYLITLFLVVFIGIIILMVLKSSKSGKISIEKLENKMVVASKKYFDDNNKLPINDKDSEKVTLNELIEKKYLKSLNKLLRDKSLVCTGEVTVTNNGGYYLYSPNIDCGEKYKTKKLYEIVTDIKNVVTERDGLYKINNDYVFRGEKLNNYVSFDEQLWRILRVNSDNTIRMIQVNKTKEKVVWDDRYNIEKRAYIGINNFSISRIKDTIKDYWLGEKIVYNKNKAFISTQPLCIGARHIDDTDKTNKKDCSITDGMYSLTLPLPSDYIVVSLDSNCKYVDSSACTNYNYLATFDGGVWTTIPDQSSTYKAYKMEPNPYLTNTSSQASLRFVVNISNEVNYISGDGSQNNPYVIK